MMIFGSARRGKLCLKLVQAFVAYQEWGCSLGGFSLPPRLDWYEATTLEELTEPRAIRLVSSHSPW